MDFGCTIPHCANHLAFVISKVHFSILSLKGRRNPQLTRKYSEEADRRILCALTTLGLVSAAEAAMTVTSVKSSDLVSSDFESRASK